MKSRDFCYWLQGFFELSEIDSLSVEQVSIVARHLAMVVVHEGDRRMSFCHWLDGVLSMHEKSRLDEKATALVRSKLNEVFLHVIDPGFPASQQKKLSEAHQKPSALQFPNHKSDDGQLFRC